MPLLSFVVLTYIKIQISHWDLPFTRKPSCGCLEPPTNANVEVLIEDGVGAASTSVDMLILLFEALWVARVPAGLS